MDPAADRCTTDIVSTDRNMCKAWAVSATYVAWNGQSYPWPPPVGWYEASDGRWWADGTGPDPGDLDLPLESEERADALDALDAPDTQQADPQSASFPSHLADPASPDLGPLVAAQEAPALADHLEAPSAAAAMGVARTAAGTTGAGDRLESIGPMPSAGVWQPDPSPSNEQPTTAIMVAIGAAVALLVAIGAFVALSGGDDGNGIDGNGNLVDSEVAEATNGESSESDASIGTGGDDAGSAEQSPDEQPSGSSTSVEESTEGANSSLTTNSTQTSRAATSTSATTQPQTAPPNDNTSANDEKVADFRLFLEANGLSGQLLSDEDLIEFGTSFCVFAVSSETFDQYVGFREEAVAQSNSILTADELALAVDGAVSTFCPADARRLGIGD